MSELNDFETNLNPIFEDSPIEGIAIIGMAGRWPGAPDVATFWQNLLAGKDTITRFTPEQLEARDPAKSNQPEYVRARGVLEDAALFDADFFGISPREADFLDPQHRLLLETCHNALEDSGYVPQSFPGEIGLFAGCSLNTYLLANLAHDRAFLDTLTAEYQVGDFQVALGNDKDFLTTRVAYKLNLRGPCVTVQAACATSLVAVAQAAQSLLNYQCDMALAGGVSVTFPQHRGHIHQEGSLASADGVCRSFDAAASGTVFGHGVGAVLLKRADEALRDGDHIYAVIRGLAVNNDGAGKAGYMAPSVEGQARVIESAQAMAGFSPDTITAIEAHGTGTPLGDPIEVAALTRAFRTGTDRTNFCTIGTAKANIGHLDAAAGVTGLIKMALSLENATLPGLAHFTSPNPHLALAGSPFRITADPQPWTSEAPRRAGVSAFGVGGVNAHVVLEEAPSRGSNETLTSGNISSVLPASSALHPERSGRSTSPSQSSDVTPRQQSILCLSARSNAALAQAKSNLAAHLESHPEARLPDIAFTLSTGRRHFPHRFAFAASSPESAITTLRESSTATAPVAASAPRIAFLFSGQGSQFPGMGRSLYETELCYKQTIDECATAATSLLSTPLTTLLFDSDEETLQETRNSQPALFATELALARLYQSWGIQPELMAGHSLGEFVAATLVGVFTPAAAMRLVCRRALLMQSMAAGAMLSVPLPADALTRFLSPGIELAAANSPRSSVLAGSLGDIEALEATLATEGIAFKRLRTSHAFHSRSMQPMLDAFEQAVVEANPQPPAKLWVSTLTGDLITPEEAISPTYWSRQCRETVRFSAAVRTLLSRGIDTFMEVGPGHALTSLTLHHKGQPGVGDFLAISSLASPGASPERTPIYALADLWSRGALVNWEAFYTGQPRRRVSLPTYPFERRLHWVSPPAPHAPSTQSDASIPPSSDILQISPVQPMPLTPAAAPLPRLVRLQTHVAEVLSDLSGFNVGPQDYEANFLELGFDSLFLTQATGALSKAFAVKLTFRQLMEQFSSITALATHLDAILPIDAFAEAPAASPSVAPVFPLPSAAANSDIQRLLSDQIATLSQMFTAQVSALQAAAAGLPVPQPVPTLASTPPAPAQPPASTEVRHGSFRSLQPTTRHDITPAQQSYIENLVRIYQQKTPGSKQATAAARLHLADPRAVAGFRPQWKEMVYPLVTDRALGSRIWDIDGNEYIDIVNGYGCILFGHSPEFVVRAAHEQLDRGVAIGPQSALAGEVAALLCELTGNDRATFCNTGSEAVMAAIRVARTVTGRDRIVYFAGDYHGTFDEVLIRNTPRGSAPVAPGIPLANVGNVTVLEYGADASLAFIREHADGIAAVLIEPVQTRNPGLQPIEFIREVRRITEQTGSALILDEVVTGFRLAPGGVQAEFGIRADMCTYGKVIGGGHPIGVLSGKRQYLDALDGGAWQYGDDSAPEVGVTFFAGTFVRHPLALAAARSVLNYLKQQGPGLQRSLNAKAAGIAQRLDAFLAERGVPTRVHSFASWFYFVFPHESRFASVFYYAMRARGIHIQEGYPCFLTTAHTDADLAAVEQAFRETVLELQAADILPGKSTQAAPTASDPELSSVPTTAAQREIFFAAALSGEANCAFNESITVRLQGSVRRDALTHALRTAIQRHDALRSTVSPDGETLNIASQVHVEPEQVDLQHEFADLQRQAVAARIEAEARKPFDLHNGPLLRLVLFQLAPDETILLLVAHHVILDGWSANQFLEEVGKLYSNPDVTGSDLAPVFPFSRFAAREQSRAATGYFASNEHYWVEKFTGLAPKLDLPSDRPRPALKSYNGGTIEGRLSAEQRDTLKKLSTRNGCTLFATLLSGFQLLLHRLSGQEEVVVGISAAGQALDENTSLVGHCVNFLPMLSKLQPNETLAEHLKSTRTALLDAYDHQEFTYGTLLSKLKLERDPSRLPLIEVQFNLERVGDNVRFEGLTGTIRANPKRFVNTDLFLNVIETDDGLDYMCDYNADLFDASTVERWMANWSTLLASASEADSAVPVANLNVLPASERDLVLNAWNQTAVDFGPFESVPAAFLRQAAVCPAKTAVVCGARRWTYAELAEYVQLLAARMLHEGLKPNDLVGICIERSPEMIGALLAVLMTGAAYVPLDPRHPRERMSMIVADAGISMLLCGRDPSVETTAKILKVTGPQANAGKANCAALDPEDLAYVIYTSGSTGIPKGVAIQHGALRNLLCSLQRTPGFVTDDVFLAVTTLAFDIATLELLKPLLVGAQLIIATEDQVQDGRQLLQLIANAHVTALQATPGAWRLLLDAGWNGVEPLKVLCGGEALPRDLADRLTERSSDVWNMYGPTETTIWSSATRVLPGSGPITIGPPIANTQFYILDERQQPVPLGCTGELLIGGEGLASSYWKRPELTAEKFLPNPFHPGRMYRTGDLARLRANGTIELLGRSDFQVKLRGYRIELGDIEAALTRHPAVSEAAVVQHRPNGETARSQLIAFAVTKEPVEIGELRNTLASTLPEYMVPAAIHSIHELPRNTNGKVDRKVLERLAGERSAETPTQRRTLTLPETIEEKQLATIWSEVLGVQEIGTTESIFELGADSLLIFRIAARAANEGLPITARMIFQYRTISDICRALVPQKAANPSPARTRVSIPVVARDTYRRSKVEVDG